MISKLYAEILVILRNNPMQIKGIVNTAKTIMDSQIENTKSIATELNTLRDAGLVISWREDGKNIHCITEKGNEALTEFTINNTTTVHNQSPANNEISQSTTHKTAPGGQTDLTQAVHQEAAPSAPQLMEDVDKEQNEKIPQTFDPFGDIYANLQQAQAMLKKLPLAPIITNKDDKLELLSLLRNHYQNVNQDAADLLNEIICDLKPLQAA